MTEHEQIVDELKQKTTLLLARFQQLERENYDLRAKLEARGTEIVDLKSKLDQKNSEYEALKTAKVLSVSDSDIEHTKERLAKMIRDVNRCIAVLKQ